MDKIKQLLATLQVGNTAIIVKVVMGVVLAAVVLLGGLHGIADYVAGAITAYLLVHNV